MMLNFRAQLCPSPTGLYCPPGDFYIDPVQAVTHAVITHAHSDHALAGHGAVAATTETQSIMALRYGTEFAGSSQSMRYSETVVRNGVGVTLVPKPKRWPPSLKAPLPAGWLLSPLS